jgi:hypothetical protein
MIEGKAGTSGATNLDRHVWMAPDLQGFCCVEAMTVACGHVSGLLSRPRPQALMGTVDRA